MDILDILKVIGAFGTLFSIIWAIYTFRRAEDRRRFAQARSSMVGLRSKISRMDQLLAEAEFSIVAASITEKIRPLKPENWSCEQFSNVLFSDDVDYRNYVAQAIHEGRLNCQSISVLNSLTRELLELPSEFKEPFPVISRALEKLIFYVLKMSQIATSPSIYNGSFSNPQVAAVMRKELEKHYNEEDFFFAELCILIGNLSGVALLMDKFGQNTFNEAEKCISIIVDTFSRLSDAELRASSRKQRKFYEQVQGDLNSTENHAVDDALTLLQGIRTQFSDAQWDEIVTSKTKIVSLMTSEANKSE